MLFIGIDLGTSSTKLLLCSESGEILNSVSKEYPLSFPQPGWAEQDPDCWWRACLEGVPELLDGFDGSSVAGIGAGGQMHGLVALDSDDNVIRPAILWNDGRTADEVAYLNDVVGRKRLSDLTANIAFAGFTAPKLLWMKKHEPGLFSRIARIMLPKDYINYRLTGVHCSDFSDASGMLLLDVKNRKWSDKMLSLCDVGEGQMPKLFESYEVVGEVQSEVAAAMGLGAHVKVVAGAGDNAAAAVGTGTVGDGHCNISIGTSGTVFISSDSFRVDPNNALHAFAHADGGYHLMGCMLSAASCNKWFCEDILNMDDFALLQAEIADDRLGRNDVFFLPYLMGERSPVNDTNARATFTGMTLGTSRSDLVLAVLEGVAFAIRDSFEVARSLRIDIRRSMLCGGGSKSPLWRRIFANVLDLPLDMVRTEQGPGLGAAMLAMVGCGVFQSVRDASDALVKTACTIEPDGRIAALYEERYQRFRAIYPAMKEFFAEAAAKDSRAMN